MFMNEDPWVLQVILGRLTNCVTVLNAFCTLKVQNADAGLSWSREELCTCRRFL